MSTTIDQRVVSLQFDNKQFERNTATTMSTLDKLKEKLTFNKASKGLEDVGHAAKNVNLNGLGSGVEAVTAKFSAMQVIGITALANITNSAVNAGKRMVKALTIDPVTTGFKEYETQINATQTILANTKSKGSTIDDVNAALEELNKYADKTIYNFTEMTRNIGTFTAAGVDLETSVNAIQGIANLAAVSGSTSQQASTAMYQLSQALSTGTVRLMDWNSVVNAGMGGEMFQNALRETSEELQTGAEAAIKANGSFRESLQTGWLTADVLTATLKKFTTSGANEYVAKYTGLSQEAIETTLKEAEATAEAAKAKGEEADAIELAADALAKSSGKSKEEIYNMLDFARSAEDAATKVKTFTQLWDVLKESAQSGWSQTWKLIVGDFNEAKGLLTPLADFLTGFINKMSDWRNRILQIALDFAAPWKAISDKIGKVSDVVSKVTGTLEYFQDVVDKVWHGDFNNWGDNPDRRDLLKKAGYDPKVVQYLVNLGEEAHKAGKTYKLTAEDVEKAHKKYGKSVELTAEETEAAVDSFNNLSDAKLIDAGLTEEEIRLYRALEEEAAKAGISVGELAEEMSNADGRTMLIDSFKNVGKLIGEIAGAAKEAWVDIFNPPSAEVLGVRLYGAIRSLKEFTESLTIVDKETGKLTKNGENIKSIFEGLFAAIDIVITLTAGPLKFIFKMATQLCKVLGVSVLDVAGGLGEFIVGIRDGIDGILDFTKVFEYIVPPIKNALSAFKDWIGKLKESENLPRDIAMGIANGLSKAWKAVKNFFKNLPENISNAFDGVSESPLGGFVDKLKSGCKVAVDVVVELGKMIKEKIMKYLTRAQFEEISADSIAGLIQGLKDKASTVWAAAVEMVSNLVQKVKDFLGIHSPSTVFIAIGGFIIAGLISGLQNGIPDSLGAIKGVLQPILDWLKSINIGSIVSGIVGIGIAGSAIKIGNLMSAIASPLEGLGAIFEGTGEVLAGTGKVLAKSARPIAKVIKSTTKVVKSAAKVLDGFASELKAEAFKTRMEGVKIAVESLIMLIVTIAVISYVCDPVELLKALGVVLATGLVLVGLAWLMSKISESSISIGKNGVNIDGLKTGLLGIASAILILAVVMKILGGMTSDEAESAFKRLGGIIAALLSVILIFGWFVKGKQAQNIDKFGKMLKKLAGTLLIMVLVVKLCGLLNSDDLLMALGVFGEFAALVFGMALISKLAGKNVEKMGSMMLKMSISLLLMVAVIKLAAGLSEDEIDNASDFLLAFVMFVGGLAVVSRIGGNAMQGLGKMLLGISISMLLLIGVMKLAGMLTPDEIEQGLNVIKKFAIMIGALILLTKIVGSETAKVAGTILAFSVAIGILAAIAIVISMIDPAALDRGVAYVGALAIMIGLMVLATKNATDAKGTMIGIAVAIGVMAAAIALLTLIDPTELAVVSGLMTVLMGMMALILYTAGKAGKDWKSIGVIAAMAVAIVAIGVILAKLAALPIEQTIGSAIALGGLMLVMTAVLAALILIGKKTKDALKGVLALTAMAVPLLAFVGVLALMQNVKNAMANVQALIVLATAMTLLLIPLTVIGAFGTTGAPYLGALALLAMAVPLLAFVGVLALMSGIQHGVANAMALTTLITAIGDVLFKLSVVAPLAIIGVAALTAMIGLMTVIGVIVGVVGALAEQIGPLLDAGIPLMIQLASGLGEMIGSFIASLAGEVMNILPQLGLTLSVFMINATPFIIGAKMVDSQVLAGVGILAGAILALTAADLIVGVTSFLQGGSSFADLGTQLSQFMLNAMPFIMGAAMISEDMMSGVKALAETILILTAANVIEGLTSWLTGGSSLESFAAQLPILGAGLAAFSSNLGTFTPEQVETVKCAADAVKTLASAAAEIPNTGGLLASIVGENDLGVFAAQFPILGSGLAAFLTNVGIFTEEQVATVNCAAQAIKTLAQASSEIPNSGGWLGQIVGENDLGVFAAQFPVLGTGLRGFLDNVGTFTEEQVATVDCAAQAIKTLASASSEIPNSGGWLGQIVGDNDLAKFAEQFPSLGSGLADFLTNVGTFTDDQVTTVDCAAGAIKALASAASEIPNTGGLLASIVGDNDLGDFASKFPKVGEGIKGFVDKLGSFSDAQLNTVSAGVSAIHALSSLANADLDAAEDDIVDFAEELPEFADNLKEFCSSMPSTESTTAAISNINKILTAVKDIGNANTGVLSTFADNLKKVGDDAVDKFVSAFTSDTAKTDLKAAAKSLAAQAPDGADDKKSAMESAGKDLGSGLVTGIDAKQNSVYWAGYRLGQKAVQGEKDGQKSNSPSKLTIQSGKWLGQGLIIGIDKMGRSVYRSGYSLGESAVKSTSSAISRIADAINTDIDAQPTIRPIMDLSDVHAGASAINNLLNTNSSIGVVANAGRIGGMMNRYSQNRGNDELVSEITKLRRDFNNADRSTYNINGITYDDGSNISDAVQTLIRAARVERRR